jgi:hypothetical protein
VVNVEKAVTVVEEGGIGEEDKQKEGREKRRNGKNWWRGRKVEQE